MVQWKEVKDTASRCLVESHLSARVIPVPFSPGPRVPYWTPDLTLDSVELVADCLYVTRDWSLSRCVDC